MTKTFRWFLMVTLMLLSAGLYTGDRIFFIGFGICVSIMAYSLATSLWVLMDFNYTQSINPPQVTKGSNAILEMEIHNDKLFIFPFIKIYYQLPDSWIIGRLKESSCSVLPLRQYVIKEEIHCNIRGRFPLGITKVEIGDLFGLFIFPMELSSKSYYRPLSIDVWPRIINLANLPIPQTHHEGSLNTSMMGTQEFSNISDIRQYRFGDPLKKIHWKLSSKLQEIQVKNYETNTQPEILLLIETSYQENRRLISYQIEDQMVECATAIVHHLLSKWIPVELITYTKTRQALTGKNLQDFDEFYDFLAYLPFSSSFSVTDIIRMECHTLSSRLGMFLIVQTLSPQLFNTLYSIKDSGISLLLFYIIDPHVFNTADRQIIQELEEKGINTIVVETDQRLDNVLEAFSI